MVQEERGSYMSDERRRFSRISFKVNAVIIANDISYSAEEITDLSVGGCMLPIKADLEPGTACRVRILLSGTSSDLSIRVDGEINRCASGTVAVKFTRTDPDSLIHLQNIIRYNSPDPDIIDKEILDHPGLV